MNIKINQDIQLELFDTSFIQHFFDAIHRHKETDDHFTQNLQRKYGNIEKLHLKIDDALENKYKLDGTPDFFIFYQGHFAGIFEFHPLTEEDFVELGYWLFPQYRRKGIISSIFPAMIQYTKDNFFKTNILATTPISNIPSQKLLEHLQFQRTGRILEFKQASGNMEKEIEYILPLCSQAIVMEK